MLSRIKQEERLARQLSVWGEDLESFLYGNVSGKINSWLVFWALLIIEKEGYCLNPYESLVENIGFDGTGVHCGSGKLHTRLRPKNNMKDFTLPDKVEFPSGYERSYRDYFVWTSAEKKLSCYNNILLKWLSLRQEGKQIADYFTQHKIEKIAVWGRGSLCERLLRELKGKTEIVAIVESKTSGEPFCGIPAVELSSLPQKVQMIVVIPAYDFEKITKRAQEESQCKLIALDRLLEEMSAGI